MKTHLVCRMSETGKFQKDALRDVACKIAVDKIPDGIIGHGAFDYVVVVVAAGAALSDKVKPCCRDFLKLQHVQGIVRLVTIDIE